MARYAETLKNRVVAKLLPPESASVSAIAKEVGVTVQTLERWRDEAQSPRVRIVVALL
jgi:transposase-like protein